MLITGETAEALFVYECQRRGISCSKPFSGKLGYDFIVEADGKLNKVQVKTTGRGEVQFTRGSTASGIKRKRYRENDVDFFACFNSKTEAWTIIPFSTKLKTLRVIQKTQYTEAWNLLKH